LVSGIPTIEVQLDGGCAGQFLVDVGNSFGLIVHGSLVNNCRMFAKNQGRKQVRIYGGGVGSGFQSWLCRLDTLRIGPYAIPQPIAGLSLSTHGIVGSKELGGNIGNGVLQRFRCTFDYAIEIALPRARRPLRGEPTDTRASAPIWCAMSDACVAWASCTVASRRGGLKEADEVIEIDGRAAATFTPRNSTVCSSMRHREHHTIMVMRDFKADEAHHHARGRDLVCFAASRSRTATPDR
jgi:hypothetical protein